MKVARAFYVACRCAGPTLRDHDQVLAVLKRHEDVQWVVVRPGRLVEGEAKGLLKESDSPGATLTYEDMAKYNVDLITSDQNNHKFIYPAYAS
ncbi:unnamed protein product [Chondrus crispus]|uniref:NAD(P)-binding domain-containing protein n=1 Tax=Chondrus crispus TaxID=2769 RepID=R7QLI2_CHOCR|nr:unnamed protein product [Chondrus crispus]CDF38331.1 unnamed protein product [Chondrus crispus]|eukprot:XP_005718216.1 unnamed protein product [Chondrus crispus]